MTSAMESPASRATRANSCGAISPLVSCARNVACAASSSSISTARACASRDRADARSADAAHIDVLFLYIRNHNFN